MSYQVLARKLRPATFAELVGQDHVVRALTHALDNDQLHHAYLFTGTRGVGKTTIARILAKSLNCEQGVSATPCGECSICREVAENRFIDLIEVDAASRTRVDDTRELLENAQYLPTRGKFKVYLIDEVHMLSAASFNALLKTLEEPPEYVKFLLATTDPKKVPVTVLSRCLQFQLKNISAEKIAAYLAQVLIEETVQHESTALEIIARAARGSMRDALSITDQAIAFGQGQLTGEDVAQMLGGVGRDEIGALMAALVAADTAKLLSLSAELAERSADFADVLSEVIAHLHRMAIDHATGKGAELPAETVQLYYQIALVGYRDLQIAPDPRIGFEMTLLRLLAFTPEQGGRAQEVPGTGVDQHSPTELPKAKTSAPESAAPQVMLATPITPVPEEANAIIPDEIDESPVDTQWFDLVKTLPLAGVARMIIENSVRRAGDDDERVRLLLDPRHDTLLSDAQQATIQRTLAQTLHPQVKLTIEVAAFAAESPAQRQSREAQERQQAAEASIDADDTVQSLLSEFGGRVQTVTPEHPSKQGGSEV